MREKKLQGYKVENQISKGEARATLFSSLPNSTGSGKDMGPDLQVEPLKYVTTLRNYLKLLLKGRLKKFKALAPAFPLSLNPPRPEFTP